MPIYSGTREQAIGMAIRYTRKQLAALEQAVAAADYALRYERGPFRSASCRVHADRVVVVNKFLSLEAKIDWLLALLQREGRPLPAMLVRLAAQRADQNSPKGKDNASTNRLQAAAKS